MKDALTPEQEAAHLEARRAARRKAARIIEMFVGSLELDIVNGCMVTIDLIVCNSEDPEIAPLTAEALRRIVTRLEGITADRLAQHPAPPGMH